MLTSVLCIDILNFISKDILFILQILVLFDTLISTIIFLEKHNFCCDHSAFLIRINIIFIQALSKGIVMLVIYGLILILNYCADVYLHLGYDFFSYIIISVIFFYIKYILCSLSNITFIRKIFGDKLIKLLEQKKTL